MNIYYRLYANKISFVILRVFKKSNESPFIKIMFKFIKILAGYATSFP